MNVTDIRRQLIVQALFLLIGWFAVLACHASLQSAPDAANVFDGLGIVAAFVAFGFAGRIRAQINRSIRETESSASELSLGSQAA
jgi:hypothetical protein